MLLSMECVTTPGHVSFRFSLPPLEKNAAGLQPHSTKEHSGWEKTELDKIRIRGFFRCFKFNRIADFAMNHVLGLAILHRHKA